MLLQSLLLAGLVILPLLLRLFFPYFWTDVLYLKDLFKILLKFASRRRRRPLFLALDRFLERTAEHPHKPFVVFENKTYSYEDTDRESNKIANALRTHSALKEGDTAAIFMGNEPAFIFTWLALSKIGCASALLNNNIRSQSLLHCFKCCGAKLMIITADLQAAVEEILVPLCEDEVCVFVMGMECGSVHMQSLSEKVEQASDTPIPHCLRANVSFKDPAVYIYTSGTTGLPKAAVINHTRLLAALAVLAANGVTNRDVIYVNLPLYHTAAFLIGFIGSVETGSTVILKRKFSASQFWNDCRKHNVTVIQYIGETMRYLCNTPKRADDKEHNVRLAIGNGLRADIWREFLSRFGKIVVREFYASTEGNVGFVNYTGKIGAIGRINFLHKKMLPYALIKYDTELDEPIRDVNGRCIEVLKGETGLLVSKITEIASFEGYARNLEQTEKKRLRNVFQEGDVYFNSGDLMKIDHDNFIYFQDRLGDTFRWKGENVATTEVLDIVTQVDFIKEANVYGVEVPGHEGKIGMVAVTVKNGALFDGIEMFNHVTRCLPTYAQPRFLRIQNAVEVTSTFKQLKMKLMREGFNPTAVSGPLYFLSDREQSYVAMTMIIYDAIISGTIRL